MSNSSTTNGSLTSSYSANYKRRNNSTDEYTSSSISGNNESNTSGTSNTNNNDSKKLKLEAASLEPSKVVHLRGLPTDVRDSEVYELGIKFGPVVNMLILKGKCQAFMEMDSTQKAITMVHTYQQFHPKIRGNLVYFQYSKYNVLKLNSDNTMSSTSNASADHNTLTSVSQSAQQLQHSSSLLSLYPSNSSSLFNQLSSSPNLHYNLNLALQQQQQQQQQNPLSQLVSAALSNQTCMVGQQPTLAVPSTKNTSGMLDFLENPSIMTNTTRTNASPVLHVSVENMIYPITVSTLYQIFSKISNVLRIVTFVKVSQFQACIEFPSIDAATLALETFNGKNIYTGCCVLRLDYSRLTKLEVKNNNDRSWDFTKAELPNLTHFQTPSAQTNSFFNSSPELSNMIQNPNANVLFNTIATNNPSLFHIASLGLNKPMQQITEANKLGCVIHASNLDEEHLSTPDSLFTLFGIYGDVIRVKMIFNMKGCALIQFKETREAQLAIAHLNNIELFGQKLTIRPSKYVQVSLPQNPDDVNTKEYAHSILHRFRNPNSLSIRNVFQPCPVLHISSLSTDVTDTELAELFSALPITIVKNKFIEKDGHKVAFYQFESISDAVACLLKFHNHKIRSSNYMKISFAKNSTLT